MQKRMIFEINSRPLSAIQLHEATRSAMIPIVSLTKKRNLKSSEFNTKSTNGFI